MKKLRHCHPVYRTSRNPEDAHDADDGRVDWNDAWSNFLESNADHRHDDDQHVQLVPTARSRQTLSDVLSCLNSVQNVTTIRYDTHMTSYYI